MPTAVICPEHTLNSKFQKILKEKTDCDVLNVIGSRRIPDLKKYDRIILVYQYALSPIRKEFREFCEKNRDALKGAQLVVDIPTSILENDAGEAQKGLMELISYFDTAGTAGGSVALFNTNCTTEQKQKKFAESLGIGYEGTFDWKIAADRPVIVTAFVPSVIDMKVSKLRATLYIAAGVCAIPLGVIMFYVGTMFYTRLIGLSFFVIGGGFLYVYMAYQSRKMAEWRDG